MHSCTEFFSGQGQGLTTTAKLLWNLFLQEPFANGKGYPFAGLSQMSQFDFHIVIVVIVVVNLYVVSYGRVMTIDSTVSGFRDTCFVLVTESQVASILNPFKEELKMGDKTYKVFGSLARVGMPSTSIKASDSDIGVCTNHECLTH